MSGKGSLLEPIKGSEAFRKLVKAKIIKRNIIFDKRIFLFIFICFTKSFGKN
ncbi:hypothetical protein KL86DYS2_12126 [uncultured Dysgonomonas sp.]|uniref:Uncharacterized protein n=1 Tax=uncultured Dysgonomonas sp. TaxID=206096 RepID=A0A212JQY6_9BACT|nr:hypothetical protein KL86DYS2_12126 [uncultured Dysgonomonas sp.]